ncbi:MAG: hypothetical protein QNJ44_10850 [Rhodobacter sp.]|nr:hypothetical protein [Rhodobacter sp.]
MPLANLSRLAATLATATVVGAGAAAAQSCDVGSMYHGQYTANYTAGSHAGMDYVFNNTLYFSRSGNYIHSKYITSSGVSGEGTGVIDLANCTVMMNYHSTTPSCPGTYYGPYTFSHDGGALSWTFNGQDCWGTLNGQGQADEANIN